MNQPKRTVLHERHAALGAKLVLFAGWDMPVFYRTGIVDEHLATRKNAGLFDVSHMGRFSFYGPGALEALQKVLTNHAAALDPAEIGAQYTLLSNERGGAVDDAYLYRFDEEEYLLVVNAANTDRDWEHLQHHLAGHPGITLENHTDTVAMLALQGPRSRPLLEDMLEDGSLPEPRRNAVSTVSLRGRPVRVARTGYTGEPLCFELFMHQDHALEIWDGLVEGGAVPVGLGARDTLRLEACLPLYGHELGRDPDGNEIPIMACPLSKFAVSFAPAKGAYIGREALQAQFEALSAFLDGDYRLRDRLPRLIMPLAVAGRGVARQGARVFQERREVGIVTSGTMVPYWSVEGQGLEAEQTDRPRLRSIALAYLDCGLREGDRVEVEIRGKGVEAVIVPYHLRSDAPPLARPILWDHKFTARERASDDIPGAVHGLLREAVDNHLWRQRRCINLIPSEMTASSLVRLLSVADPSFRYAEHRKTKAFYDLEVFYYQGTDFISAVEKRLAAELCRFLGCPEVETRLISGQMANMAVYSAMVDFVNRADRRREPRRLRMVMTNHIGKGGHLSAQPMGGLRDFVARDPRTERPAVVHFPVELQNPYRMDVPAALELIGRYRPELVVCGKSMVLHPEPVAAIRRFLDDQNLDTVLMYDIAHVLGLVGPHFQEPIAEGADLVTGSTHKTFFGPQRGIVAGRFQESELRYELWEAIERRTFPGSVSNHHLGTLLALLMAAYEMNHFRDSYQPKVIANAKAFARALNDCGLSVAGDPAVDFTETHQVVVHIGYGRGPAVARRLEENNIICNYQALPGEEGFTASGGLRLGVAEMTRFGLETADFEQVAAWMADVILRNASVAEEVARFRSRFLELQYCFGPEVFADLVQQLHGML